MPCYNFASLKYSWALSPKSPAVHVNSGGGLSKVQLRLSSVLGVDNASLPFRGIDSSETDGSSVRDLESNASRLTSRLYQRYYECTKKAFISSENGRSV